MVQGVSGESVREEEGEEEEEEGGSQDQHVTTPHDTNRFRGTL